MRVEIKSVEREPGQGLDGLSGKEITLHEDILH